MKLLFFSCLEIFRGKRLFSVSFTLSMSQEDAIGQQSNDNSEEIILSDNHHLILSS